MRGFAQFPGLDRIFWVGKRRVLDLEKSFDAKDAKECAKDRHGVAGRLRAEYRKQDARLRG
jgi:hypothetical protein